MAGSSITPTRTTQDIDSNLRAEVILSIACVSDDTTGLIPDMNLTGLGDYVLTQIQPIPDAVAPATSAFEIRIADVNDGRLFLSGSIAVDSKEIIGGHQGSNDGNYPRLDEAATLEFVDPADHVSTISIGNSKEMTIILRFEKR